MSQKLWGGRFKKAIDPDFERFSASLKWDRRLLPYDLQIDAAHTKALAKCGVLKTAEAKKLLAAIASLQKSYTSGALKLNEQAEDVHSAIQEKLKSLCGDLADKIHTGRSRNDLVNQSTRLYCREHAARVALLITDLQKAILAKAEEYKDVLVPGMTHLQNAQVLSQGHIFLAYVEMLDRAKKRLAAAQPFFDICVLGSGALAGTTFNLDQKLIARELGLSQITRNSYDVSGDRDFVVNMLSSGVFVGLEISRIAEDLMIAQTRGFATVDIDEAFCTGSSMMPQKKNADFVELSRGVAGSFIGNFMGFVSVLKGLPTSYNRDLQWDKKFLFDTVELCEDSLKIYIKFFKGLRMNRERAKEALKDESLYATDLADYLVMRGVAFKKAHEIVGQIVSFSEEKRVRISAIGLDLLQQFSDRIEGDVYDLFSPAHSVNLKKTMGSTNLREIDRQIRYWKKDL